MNQSQMTEATETAFKDHIRSLEIKIGLPEGYVYELRGRASDWELITQMSLVVEAALTDAIVEALHNERVRSHIGSIGQANRIGLAGELEILTVDEVKQLKVFANVRNRFAHRVSNVSKTLDQFFEALPADSLREMDQALAKPHFCSEGDISWRDRLFYTGVFALMTVALSNRLHAIDRAYKEEALAEFEKGYSISIESVRAQSS